MPLSASAPAACQRPPEGRTIQVQYTFASHTVASLSSIGNSGLQAAQLRLDASAHNVANLNTPAFAARWLSKPKALAALACKPACSGRRRKAQP